MKKLHRLTLLAMALLVVLGAAAAQAAKVEVCHIPPGNPDNWHTIIVSENALQAHLNHGDLEGSCLANCETLCDDGDACTIDVESDSNQCICRPVPEPVNCDDSNPCTADSCDSINGACVTDTGVLDGNVCDDGDPGTTGEICQDGTCIVQGIITKDTVRACELAASGITDDSTLTEVVAALEMQFGAFLAFPPNPASELLRRIEVVRQGGCVVTEWEFRFLGDPRAPVFPFEVIPSGPGDDQYDILQYNTGCGCRI